MGVFGRWFGGKDRPPAPRATRRRYEAAHAEWQSFWRPSQQDARLEVAGDLGALRARARDLVRNRPYARRIIDALTDALVGQGLRPTIDAPRAVADRAYDLWEAWGSEAASGARLSMAGLQAHIVRAWLQDGEVLIRWRSRYPEDLPGLPPLQVQALEADLLPVELARELSGGWQIVSGVELDQIGRVRAYHLLRAHPGSQRPTRQTVRIPADEIAHLYTPERPGQVRGVPILAPVILSLQDLSGALESVRVAFRAAAMMVATVEGGSSEPGIAPDGIAEERDGPDPVLDSQGRAIEGLAPGMILYAPDGRQIRVHQPQPPQGLTDYARAMLREIAAGVGLSYHVLSGDMSDASFAQAKLGLITQQQRIDALREQVLRPMFLDPLWRQFVAHAQAVELLPRSDALNRVRWSRPHSPTADRYQEARASLLEIRAGLRSRTSVVEAMGRDPDEVDAEIAVDQARADRLGLVLDSDPRKTTLSGSVQQEGQDG